MPFLDGESAESDPTLHSALIHDVCAAASRNSVILKISNRKPSNHKSRAARETTGQRRKLREILCRECARCREQIRSIHGT